MQRIASTIRNLNTKKNTFFSNILVGPVGTQLKLVVFNGMIGI